MGGLRGHEGPGRSLALMARRAPGKGATPPQTLFRVCEIADAAGLPHETVRRWLDRAGLLETVAPGVRMVSREHLACEMPRLWDAVCRRYEQRQRELAGDKS